MKDVGEFSKRNKEFHSNFNRDKIIKSVIKSDLPIIFDVGAHHGQSIDYLREFFPRGFIYSFEPDPDSFKILSKKKSEINIISNIALSDESGFKVFYRNKISHTNSLNKVNLNSKDSIRAKNEKSIQNSSYKDEVNSKINVETITLDEFMANNFIQSIDLLKIDVQGSEEKVLKGATNSLGKIMSIIIEISFYDYYEKSSSFAGVESYLFKAGFRLFSILEISQNPMNGRTDWAEVLYTR